MRKIIWGLVFLCLFGLVLAQEDSTTYCLDNYIYTPDVSEMLEFYDELMALEEGIGVYACVAEPFPEELEEEACPEGTDGFFYSKVKYKCSVPLEDKSLLPDSCLADYKLIERGGSTLFDLDAPNYIVCLLKGAVEPGYYYDQGEFYFPCGDLGVMKAWELYEPADHYYCVYDKEVPPSQGRSLLVEKVFTLPGIKLDRMKTGIQQIKMTGKTRKLFGDEEINLHVASESGEEIILGVVTEGAEFKEVKGEALPEASLDVYTTEEVVEEMMASEQPATVLNEALEEDKMTYSGVGLLNKIKFFFLGIVSWFVDEEEIEEPEIELPVTVEEPEPKEPEVKPPVAVEKPEPAAPVVPTCGECQYLENEVCKDYVCCVDLDCDDNNPDTEDECLDPGTLSASCFYIPIKRFDVYAKENIMSSSGTALDTGIDLKAGDILEVEVASDDTWNVGYDIHTSPSTLLGETKADGFTSYDTISPGTGVRFHYGALVGSIGDGMGWFLIGADFKQKMDKSGRLYLLCWDDVADDNSGYLTVEVKVR